MLCKNPFMQGDLPFGCGQCLPCRINRKRLWTNRIVLESLNHEKNCFITLTYDEQHHPKDGSLDISHYQKFLKRLRRAITPRKVRYFFVGEYGEQTQRPHYHAALFGVGEEDSELIDHCWGRGFTMIGDLNKDSAQYITGYVTKKMTQEDDKRLEGRHPEFARMSLRPGIGGPAVKKIVDVLETEHGCDQVAMEGDVPTALKLGRRTMPLGRYLRGKIREKIFHTEKTPEEVLQRWQKEMQALYAETEAEKKNMAKYTPKNLKKKEILLDKNLQKVRNLESKFLIYSKKGKL